MADLLDISPLNLRQYSANAVVVSSSFFVTMAEFCCLNYFDITLVKTIVTSRNFFTLFQKLFCKHSCSLVMWFTEFYLKTFYVGKNISLLILGNSEVWDMSSFCEGVCLVTKLQIRSKPELLLYISLWLGILLVFHRKNVFWKGSSS